MVLHGIALHLMILHSPSCHCIVSYGVAGYCIVGFGARAVSRKTPTYFIFKMRCPKFANTHSSFGLGMRSSESSLFFDFEVFVSSFAFSLSTSRSFFGSDCVTNSFNLALLQNQICD